MTSYISPENRQAVDELMEPLRNAKTREERDKARQEINNKFIQDTKVARDRIN
jgi:hypothetical protein